MFKKFFSAPVFALVLAIFPLSAFAAQIHIGDYFLKGGETADDDLYTAGNTATFTGTAIGDIISVGRTIFSQGTILGDAFFVGEDVHVEGEIDDDVRVIGGTITVNGTIGGDIVAVGTKVIIGPTAKIGGSLYVAGGDVEIRGATQGEAKIISDHVLFFGSVDGDVELWGKASFNDGSRIGRDFIYHPNGKPVPPTHVIITGKTIIDESKHLEVSLPIKTLLSGFFSLKLLMMLAVGFALFFLARERTEEVLLETLPNAPQRILRGLLIFIVMPAVSVLLLPSIIGIPIALVLLSLFVILLVLSWAFAGILLGAWCERLFFKRSAFPLSYRPVLLGIILLSIISFIPFVGAVFHGILMLAVAGSIGTIFFRRIREMR